MKKYFYLIWITFLMLYSRGQAQEIFIPRLSPLPDNMERQQVSLNGQWLFHASPEKDFWRKERISGWETIEVPGEWVMQGFNVEKGKAAGYYRTFTVPESWKGKRVKLRCNGIYSDSRVYINGQEAGSHLGGFTAFELDVTALVDGCIRDIGKFGGFHIQWVPLCGSSFGRNCQRFIFVCLAGSQFSDVPHLHIIRYTLYGCCFDY